MLTEGTGVLLKSGWEVNVSGTLEPQRRNRLFSAPELDVNYGLSNRFLVSLTWPWRVRDRPNRATQQAPGRVDFGVKAVLVRSGLGVSVSTYPLLSRGTHDPETTPWLQKSWALRLPVQVSRRIGPVDVAGELAVSVFADDANEISYGVVARLPVNDRIELAGEVGGTGPTDLKAENATFANGGLTMTLLRDTPGVTLNLSTGRLLTGRAPQDRSLFAFFGTQITW